MKASQQYTGILTNSMKCFHFKNNIKTREKKLKSEMNFKIEEVCNENYGIIQAVGQTIYRLIRGHSNILQSLFEQTKLFRIAYVSQLTNNPDKK